MPLTPNFHSAVISWCPIFQSQFSSYFFWQWYFLKQFNNLQFCKWDPNDHAVKVDTYLKSPYFSTSNGEYCNSFRSFSIFECLGQILYTNTLTLFWITQIKNWHLGCHGCSIDNFMYVSKLSFLNYNQTPLRPSILSILTWLHQILWMTRI